MQKQLSGECLGFGQKNNVSVSVSQVEIFVEGRSWQSYEKWAKELSERAAKGKAPIQFTGLADKH